MHWTTKPFCGLLGIALAAGSLLVGCGKRAASPAASNGKAHSPYAIPDSNKVLSYPNGLRLYIIEQGPGDYPENGVTVHMNYEGRLENGKVFDESFSEEEPLEFTMGAGSVIVGIEEAVKKMRFGSKAVAIVPPTLGYGDGGDNGLPPNIPPNATLKFDIELIGSF